MLHEGSIGGMASDMKKPKHLEKYLSYMEFPEVKLWVP
jgi:hypothetical protein